MYGAVLVPDPVVIQPRPFRTGARAKSAGRFPWGIVLGTCFFIGAVGAATFAWFFFTSKTLITVETIPKDARVFVSGPGRPSASLTGRSFWAKSKQVYDLSVERRGYVTATTNLTGSSDLDLPLRFQLEEIPWGLIRLDPPMDPLPDVYESGTLVDFTLGQEAVGDAWALPAGEHALEFRIPRHFPVVTNVVVPARVETNTLHLAFEANWAPVSLSTIPPSMVYTNEQLAGVETPAELELIQGSHPLTFKAEGFMTLRTQVVVRAGARMVVPPMVLQKTNGLIRVTSFPSMANVNVGDTFRGRTPLTIAATPDQEHVLLVAKAGFQPGRKIVVVSPGETVDVEMKLEPLEGTIRFRVNPPDAELIVDGTSFGPVPETLTLSALEHTLQLKHKDFKDHELKLTPRSGFLSSVQVDMIPKATTVAKVGSGDVQTAAGYTFKRIEPAVFQMGSSRREQGRRSNETLRDVQFKRPFYMGTREVTNLEFRGFKPDHQSGSVGKESLNKDTQPVVNILWQDAARYCNWLSAQEGLPAAYIESGTNVVAVQPMTTGYRLPSEAEWEYCARSDGAGGLLKYPWGEGFPPKEKQGNFGDQSAAEVVGLPIKDYTDGYPVSAPPGSFPANRLGLLDLGGNVAEWCHDVYSIPSSAAGTVGVDPLGPPSGSLWVVRGSSYKSSNIRDLRFAFRNYANTASPDVGFRICRYVE
ncbi:MAG: sulfatase activating formylglycine-generating enzyme [Verrucomicrobiales bacterium]|jgi:formylglycine-generating enzyme required for sulfatase activity